jgi:hypothetical protein
MLALALALVAFLAPAGQAHSASKRSPEEETLAASTKAAKAAEKAAEKAERTAATKQAKRVFPKEASGKWENGAVLITCTQVSWTFTNIPAPAKNSVAVTELLTVGQQKSLTTLSFDGAAGSRTVAIDALPGNDTIHAAVKWSTGRLHGHFALTVKLTCPVAPAFSVEKLQEIAGGGSYTTSPLTGLAGQTVDYEIHVKNTGNVPLTLGSFTDPQCDPGTVSGGPGSGALAPEASTNYLCKHLLDEADQSTGSYTATATVTGTIEGIEGWPVTHTSNTVVVKVPRPAFSVEKLQEIAGGGSYTTSPLTGLAGQTVDYEILVKNTGNVPLTLGSFTDPHCDPGTVSGGPGSGALAPEASTSFLCRHLLGKADQSAGSYTATATVTGTPPNGEGSPVTHTSNTVVVNVPTPTTSTSTTSTSTTSTSATPPPSSPSSSPASSTQPPKSGVLAFKSATVPALKGPQGCVRSSFRVTVKSAGVKSVTFYLDGHKLKALTAKNARKGLITLAINPTKLSVGSHRLMAKITMALTASSSTKPAHASRTLTVLRCR